MRERLQTACPEDAVCALALLRDGEAFFFFYYASRRLELCQVLAEMARNEELSFDWEDAHRVAVGAARLEE